MNSALRKVILACVLIIVTAVTCTSQTESRARLAVIISINGLDSYELENFLSVFDDGE